MIRSVRLLGALGAAALMTGVGAPAALADDRPPSALALTHGVASGDVTDDSVVVWARASGDAVVHVEYDTDASFPHPRSRSGRSRVSEATDHVAHVTLRELRPGTRYWYRVWLAGAGHDGRSEPADSPVGTFVTAPAPGERAPVSFLVGGDVGGQRYCRNADSGGYAIFQTMQALAPTFFIANGDMIYADGDCPADGPDGPGGWQNIPGSFPSIAASSVDWEDQSQVRLVYREHWRYNRADPYLQRFLASTSMVSQWDDHEVINDFGAGWTYWNSANATRAGYPNLVAEGRAALFDWSPIRRDAADRDRIYRGFRWGRDAELFVLDARSYRDRNDLPDTPENDKDMLGKAQLDWLIEGLTASDATWKVVSSDVPISIPTGSTTFGRDAWANLGAEPTGFERELLELLRRLDAADVENVVFVATDVHFAQTIRYATDADGDGDELELHEFVSGPLNAVRGTPRELDPAANPTSLYAEGGLFNYGYVRIAEQADGKAHLVADVRGPDGAPRPGSRVDLPPH